MPWEAFKWRGGVGFKFSCVWDNVMLVLLCVTDFLGQMDGREEKQICTGKHQVCTGSINRKAGFPHVSACSDGNIKSAPSWLTLYIVFLVPLTVPCKFYNPILLSKWGSIQTQYLKLINKAQQRMCFLRQLKKLKLLTKMLVQFCTLFFLPSLFYCCSCII